MDDLVERDGLYYEKFTVVPFTGEINEGLERGTFNGGYKEGSWFLFYENGQLQQRTEFKNGKLHGPWLRYHENGILSSKGDWIHGLIESDWFVYYSNGQLKSKEHFVNWNREGA